MDKHIGTLVPDIYKYLESGPEIDKEAITALGQRIAESIAKGIGPRPSKTDLRMSNLGTPCGRKLWYVCNEPEDAEVLSGPAILKFTFGHLLEDLVLFLVEQAGHNVEGRQDECNVGGVLGHRDAVIDGHLVDVKSASTFSFKKFESNSLVGQDSFGYLTQLGGYLSAAKDDPIVSEKKTASFLVIDKTLGNICLDTYKFPEYNYYKLVEEKRAMLGQAAPPARAYSDVPDGKSGNRKLGVACSYCPFKRKCWPGLRTFIYSTGPAFLTTVVRLPNVPEVNGT